MFTTYPHSQYYRDRTSERELCCDFPGDELFIRGLRAMELHLARYNGYVHIPVVRVMNTVHRAICILLHGNSGYEQSDYDQAIHQALGQEQLLTSIAMVTLIAILRRTDGQRARQCRSMLMDDRSEDFYEGLELYERLIGPTELRLNEEDFLTDVMRQISDLQNTVQQLTNERQQLIQERQQLKKQIDTMSKIPKHQTTVYNYGTYNDIHDNPHATIYATAPQDNQPDSILPPENDYTALVRWLEFEKLRGNDYYAEADCNRTKLCRNLLKIIGWEPDQNSLRKAQSR